MDVNNLLKNVTAENVLRDAKLKFTSESLKNVTAENILQNAKLQFTSENLKDVQANEIIVIEHANPSILENLVDPNSIEILFDDSSFAGDESGNFSRFSSDLTGFSDSNNNAEQTETKQMRVIAENKNIQGENL